MVPIKDIRPLLDHRVVIGWEYNKMVSTGFVAAVPGHTVFEKVLNTYNSFDDIDKPFKFLVNNELWSYELKDTFGLKLTGETQLLPGDIMVYPQTYFAEMKITDESYFLHDHKLSWTSPRKAKLMKPALQFTRNFQKYLEPALKVAIAFQFKKNKKAVKKMRKDRQAEDENKNNDNK